MNAPVAPIPVDVERQRRVVAALAAILPPERLLHAAEAAWARGVAQLGNRLLAAGHHTAPTRAEPLYVRNQVAQTEAERRAARSVLPANAAQIVAISA